MPGENFYLITALPTLGQLGSPAPITPARLMQHVIDSPAAADTTAALLLHDDLLQRDATQAGQTAETSPAVLSDAQMRDEQPLPEYLAPSPGETAGRAVAGDAVWEAYFRHAAAVAGRTASRFLSAWVGFEVALRNALVQRRAKALGIETGGYLVAADLADEGMDFTGVLNEWAAAPNPLAGLQVIDRARWDWINDHREWFSFRDDEIAAYAAKLMLLARWQRLTAEQHATGDAAKA